uniref:Uncharacterized protein n=1 Tax=Setaria italica TaxID=4555 RepID=K3YFH7_SETIT
MPINHLCLLFMIIHDYWHVKLYYWSTNSYII